MNSNNRQSTNFKIINKLLELVKKYPDWRFHQLLQNCGVSLCGQDQFYEESNTTLQRMISNENSRTS